MEEKNRTEILTLRVNPVLKQRFAKLANELEVSSHGTKDGNDTNCFLIEVLSTGRMLIFRQYSAYAVCNSSILINRCFFWVSNM